MICRIIPYTFEDDVTPDPDKDGLVMVAWDFDEITKSEKVFDNIPVDVAHEICDLINALHKALS